VYNLESLKKNWKIIAIIISITAVIVDGYLLRVFSPNISAIFALHHDILSGNAQSPYRYRVLVPIITEGLSLILSIFTSPSNALKLAYHVYFYTSVFTMFTLLFYYTKLFFPKLISLIGVLFVASTVGIALQDHYYQPWTFLEVIFLILGLILIYKKKYVALVFCILIATLNRETAILIPLLFFFTNCNFKNIFSQKKEIFITALFFMIWFLVYGGLRLYLGEDTRSITITEIWNVNMNHIEDAITNNLLFFGIFWIFMIKGIKHVDNFIKRSILVVPFYLVLILVYGIWFEVRLLIPLYPILLPLGLAYFNETFKNSFVK
jgi:hypothetical protein